jgi:hypothetical protein
LPDPEAVHVNKIALIGLGAAALVVALLIGVQLLGIDPTGMVPGPTATPEVSSRPARTAEPVPSPSPSAAWDSGVVDGWPHTGENPAGTYSWDGTWCAGPYCSTIGWMHNGYGSGNVDIIIARRSETITSNDEVRAVTVAGYDATYRRADALREQWIVHIEGKTVVISVNVEPGTSDGDLDEAHAIIESMRVEPMDTNLGFRLVFTLKTDDWDSG